MPFDFSTKPWIDTLCAFAHYGRRARWAPGRSSAHRLIGRSPCALLLTLDDVPGSWFFLCQDLVVVMLGVMRKYALKLQVVPQVETSQKQALFTLYTTLLPVVGDTVVFVWAGHADLTVLFKSRMLLNRGTHRTCWAHSKRRYLQHRERTKRDETKTRPIQNKPHRSQRTHRAGNEKKKMGKKKTKKKPTRIAPRKP